MKLERKLDNRIYVEFLEFSIWIIFRNLHANQLSPHKQFLPVLNAK